MAVVRGARQRLILLLAWLLMALPSLARRGGQVEGSAGDGASARGDALVLSLALAMTSPSKSGCRRSRTRCTGRNELPTRWRVVR